MPCSNVTGGGQIFWKVTATCKLKVQQDRQNTRTTDWQINWQKNCGIIKTESCTGSLFAVTNEDKIEPILYWISQLIQHGPTELYFHSLTCGSASSSGRAMQCLSLWSQVAGPRRCWVRCYKGLKHFLLTQAANCSLMDSQTPQFLANWPCTVEIHCHWRRSFIDCQKDLVGLSGDTLPLDHWAGAEVPTATFQTCRMKQPILHHGGEEWGHHKVARHQVERSAPETLMLV